MPLTTRIVVVSATPESEAMIVTVPVATAVTWPVVLTLATAELLLLHAKTIVGITVPLRSRAVAVCVGQPWWGGPLGPRLQVSAQRGLVDLPSPQSVLLPRPDD